ncbi:MAG: hypothetical protein EXS51_01595 [Candidatus Taylorbacteria bacterium]|nr:hypothetical protein [Candidatus Taylorbacteria bacterium]
MLRCGSKRKDIVKNKKRKISILKILVFGLLMFVAIIFLLPSPPRSTSPADARKSALANPEESSRTLEEMQGFMNTYLATLITETFPKHWFRLPEIQERYNLLEQKIQKQYGKGYILNPVSKYHPSSKLVSMAAGMENRNPTITLSMPSVMDMWEAQRNLGIGKEELELLFIVDWFHELDHLAGGDLPEEGEKDYPFEKWIGNEQRTWAETCEYTLRPLIEQYKFSLSPRERTYYRVWVQSGRNVHSSAWGDFIRGQYEKVRF